MTIPRHLLTALALTVSAAASAQVQQSASATFIDVSGKTVGRATLTQTPGGVLIDIDLAGIAPGEHGFHIHAVGRCDAADGFKSAGEHFAPRSSKHGYHDAGGPHGGDMPSQFAAADGRLRAHVVNPGVTLGAGATSVFDTNGSALVLHAKPDDYRSQPSGEAGDRIACAVIERAAAGAVPASAPPR